MCGIIGFTGFHKAQPILLEGLKRLEYRGYDSAGIAYFRDNTTHISIRKTAGKVSDLAAVCDDENDSTCGIGHTRWATHGGVSTANAHPHKFGHVALIHNGIIENYQELTDKYGFGPKLKSQTDTEVAAAVISTKYDELGDPGKALKAAVKEMKGSFAFCALFKEYPGKIYAIRNVSPMVATWTKEDGAFIASDLTAFIDYSKRYFVVPEYHLLTLSPEGIRLEDMDGNEVEPEYLTVDWDVSAAQKEGYPHFMLKEIHEQPDAIAKTIAPRIKDSLPDFSVDGIDDALFEDVRDITVIACGTALYAGMVGAQMIREKFGIPVSCEIASEFRYERPVLNEHTLVIVCSQSGETIDTLAALRLAKTHTQKTLALVNVKGSSIARESNYVMYTHAGPEIAVASTKAYTSQVAAFYLIGVKLGLTEKKISVPEAKEFIETLRTVPDMIRTMLGYEDRVATLTKRLIHARDVFYIGRGLDYRVAMEGALKLKEISYIHAEAYAAGELKHGTISLVEDGVPVIAISTQKNVHGKVISNIRETKARGAYVILLSRDESVTDPALCDVHFHIPDVPDEFTVFEVIVICQLLAYYTSTGRGINPDQPRNLAKSVTVE